MGEPQRSDAVESDRRSFPRFPAELLGKASVRLLGGSEVTLINFSERGILFQSETRLLVGARGTVRITVAGDTTIAAGTVVRSLVQGMASGKLAFHTALALDQPLALAAAVAERERAKSAAAVPAGPPPAAEPVTPPAAVEAPAPPPAPAGKTIEKRSHKDKGARAERPAEPPAAANASKQIAPPAPAPPAPAAAASAPPAAAPPPAPATAAGSGGGFETGSFGWDEPAGEPAVAGLSVLFISTTKERAARMQAILADHRHDIVLTTVVHSKADALADVARQHDVLLFDFAIGPDALARTLAALRSSPLGASIAIFVPQQTALPPAVSSLANACVIDTTSGDQLAVALRDAAWTPWQPVETSAGAATPREDLFWKAFDALPVPVLVVDAAGAIAHANGACAKLAGDVPLKARELASFFVADDAPAIARLIADGLAGGHHDTPVFTATTDGNTVSVMLQALSVLPGSQGPELALRCELRTEPAAAPEPEPPGPDLAAQVAALTEVQAVLTESLEAAQRDAGLIREELDGTRLQLQTARRERDELRGQLEVVERDLARARELEQAGAMRIGELERLVADAARHEVALARAQTQLAAATEEIGALRADLDALRAQATRQGADNQRAAARLGSLEAGARQAVDELEAARADAKRLTRERDELRERLGSLERDVTRARELEQSTAARIGELEKRAADAARAEAALGEARTGQAAAAEEISALRGTLETLRAQAASRSADSERVSAQLVSLESDARQTNTELAAARDEAERLRRDRDELQARLAHLERDVTQARDLEHSGAARIGELERLVADAARHEVALARAQSQLAASTEEIGTLRAELDALGAQATRRAADSERAAAKLASLESSARQAIDELKSARADAQRLTRERDKALAAAEAERARAEAAIAAAREEGKKGRKLVSEDPAPAAMLKLQRQLEELRGELKQEQDARKELEELLDQNAANLEQTIQEYEERLEAMAGATAGADDKRASKPKKSLRG